MQHHKYSLAELEYGTMGEGNICGLACQLISKENEKNRERMKKR